jgi:hypothetical protein
VPNDAEDRGQSTPPKEDRMSDSWLVRSEVPGGGEGDGDGEGSGGDEEGTEPA